MRMFVTAAVGSFTAELCDKHGVSRASCVGRNEVVRQLSWGLAAARHGAGDETRRGIRFARMPLYSVSLELGD